MNDSVNLPSRIGGVIPHFFYDVIGRIVPGAFFLASLWWVKSGKNLKDTAETLASATWSSVVMWFVLLAVLGYLLGFLLGAVSHGLVERIWGSVRPWRIGDLRRGVGAAGDETTRIETLFRERFGFEVPATHDGVVTCSWLCAYAVWDVNPYLGVLTSRWDAEALATRNLLIASLSALIYGLCQRQCGKSAVLGTIAISSFLAYGYHR